MRDVVEEVGGSVVSARRRVEGGRAGGRLGEGTRIGGTASVFGGPLFKQLLLVSVISVIL